MMDQDNGLDDASDGAPPSSSVIPGVLEASAMALNEPLTSVDALPLHEFAALTASTVPTKKRRLPDDGTEAGQSLAAGSPTLAKKTKLAGNSPSAAAGSTLSPDRSLLPPEIWHHVFSFCPPKSLGKLLAVNKLFSRYLDPASSARRGLPESAARGVLRSMEPNTIWKYSRRLFWPHMPAPLRSKTELDMWRLSCSVTCQACGKVDVRGETGAPNSRHPGPGSEGVKVIWAFGYRMCASCLLKASVKEIDLLLSSSMPSAILPALPFIFLTTELDAFSATTLEHAQMLTDTNVAKRFSVSDVEVLEKEFIQVRDMGQGTVGEWLKGLDERGNGLQHDASKWEKWELSGGIAKIRSQLYPGHVSDPPLHLPQKPTTDPTLPPHPPIPRQPTWQERIERTAEEVADLKAARKAEIQRRALLLVPPLSADVLRHIPSFQAATHIIAPLDDDAWERLKPRLLAQRADAEITWKAEIKAESKLGEGREEHQRLETTLATTKEARDRIDKEWEEVQAPLRAEIAGYADAVIRGSWSNGKKVTRENCSRFAVGTLLRVRARFYAEVTKRAASATAAGRAPPVDPPEGPFTQKLTLENMKWIYDTKIKPHTESLRRELFCCNGCDGNFKPFGFEGVIQHYAAKHTTALSLGSIVVHWRAEWPEHPPFSATGRPAKAPLNPPAANGFAPNGGVPPTGSYGYSAPGIVPPPPPPPTSYSSAAPGYGYAPPTYNDYYQPLPPPLTQPYLASPAGPVSFAPQPGYEQQQAYAPPATPYPDYQLSAMQYPSVVAEPVHSHAGPPAGQYDHPYRSYQPNNAGNAYGPSQVSAYPDLYRAKIEDIARNSREVWRALGDIKDLPGSTRVFVTIHHLVKRFRSRFYETPPLSMFIDGLSNNKEMRPVRNVNGLVCKACHLGLSNTAAGEPNRKHFSLPQLANHFQTNHVESTQAMPAEARSASLDWVLEMVLLPDVTVLSKLASSVNAAQKALLAAAIPTAFALQPTLTAMQGYSKQQGREHELTSGKWYRPTPSVTRSRSATTSGKVASPAAKDEPSAVSKPDEAGLFAGYRNLVHSPCGATSGTMSETEYPAARAERSGPPSRGLPPASKQGSLNGLQQAIGKIIPTHPIGSGGPGDQTLGQRLETASENAQRAEVVMPVKRVTDLGAAPPARLRSRMSDRRGSVVLSEGQVSEQPSNLSSGRIEPNGLVPRVHEGREVGAVADLGPADLGPADLGPADLQRSSSPGLPADWGASVRQHGSKTYTRHDDGRGWAGSPLREHSYHAVEPNLEDRRLVGRPRDGAYHSRQASSSTQRDAYSSGWGRAELAGPYSQHDQEERFDRPVPRAFDHRREAPLAVAEYPRYREDMHILPPSSPIEAYEIVQVIDEHGEYYIRRPLRRSREIRYVYEQRSANRDAGPHLVVEPINDPGARPGLARGAVQTSAAPRPWSTSRRDNAAYHEEYDPRFPAA